MPQGLASTFFTEGSVLGPQAGVFLEKHEPWEFDTGMQEDACRRRRQQQVYGDHALVGDGFHNMRDDGLAKAAAGLTTIEEVLRATQDTEDLGV